MKSFEVTLVSNRIVDGYDFESEEEGVGIYCPIHWQSVIMYKVKIFWFNGLKQLRPKHFLSFWAYWSSLYPTSWWTRKWWKIFPEIMSKFCRLKTLFPINVEGLEPLFLYTYMCFAVPVTIIPLNTCSTCSPVPETGRKVQSTSGVSGSNNNVIKSILPSKVYPKLLAGVGVKILLTIF